MKGNYRDNPLYEERFGFNERDASFRFYVVLLAVLLLVLSFRFYWISRYEMVQVSGTSMEQTLQSGEWLLLDKNERPKRGDVIVVDVRGYDEFKYNTAGELIPEKDRTTHLIKRLIAIEGDSVRCQDGKIEILRKGENAGIAWEDTYGNFGYYVNADIYDFGIYEVKEGEMFFLGDNRNVSMDSRYMQNGSRLKDRLYKYTDIYGVVTPWAMDNQGWLETVLITVPEKITGIFVGKR